MWFWNRFKSCEDKKKDDEQARTEMELALALARAEPDAFDPWEKYAEIEYANYEAHIALAVLGMQKSMIANAVEAAQRSGLIDNDEYAKYLLDETGMYMPKLKEKP